MGIGGLELQNFDKAQNFDRITELKINNPDWEDVKNELLKF